MKASLSYLFVGTITIYIMLNFYKILGNLHLSLSLIILYILYVVSMRLLRIFFFKIVYLSVSN
jgi:hypothetical protein